MLKYENMNSKKLFEILTLVNSVKSSRWNDVRKIVEIMPFIEVKEKKWNEKYKQDNPNWYPLDLSKIETWSTYEGECICLVFSNQNNKVFCEVSIYDGDNLSARRCNLRFTAKLIIPDTFIKELEQKILYALDRLAEDSYQDYLETQKKLWMSNFKSKIFMRSKKSKEQIFRDGFSLFIIGNIPDDLFNYQLKNKLA
jgi:hypothetical protein